MPLWIVIFVAGFVSSVAHAEGPGSPGLGSVLASLASRYDVRHFESCNQAPGIVLNEVCAVGTECDTDVRVSDFVEVYNGSGTHADLACYVLLNDMGIPFSPDGDLAPGEVKAWGERDLEFRIKKSDDAVILYRLGTGIEDLPKLEQLDALTIRLNQAHSLRLPDGGEWRHRGVAVAEQELRTSFGVSNQRANPSEPDPLNPPPLESLSP